MLKGYCQGFHTDPLSIVSVHFTGGHVMSILDSVGVPGKPPEGVEFEATDDEFSQEYPGIYEFLARIVVKGEPRKPGALILKYQTGKVNLCLSDAHTGSVAFHVGETMTKALQGAETRLQAGSMDWRETQKGWVKR